MQEKFEKKEGMTVELLKFAFTGVNIIPTAILILVQCYWLISIVGLLDLEFLDFDVDLEGAEGLNPLSAIAVFINSGEIPFALVFSLIVMNFWILTMLMYFIPIQAGGWLSAILLIPALVISVLITKLELLPIRRIFLERKNEDDIAHKVIAQICKLKCDLEYGKLGQAELRQEGASVVINVKILWDYESFQKDDFAHVFKKDKDKDMYYITKPLMDNGYYKEMEEN